MKKKLVLFLVFGITVSCGGPKLFNSPEDFVGGSKTAAAATHCHRTGGQNKEGIAYKLCQENFKIHYGR